MCKPTNGAWFKLLLDHIIVGWELIADICNFMLLHGRKHTVYMYFFVLTWLSKTLRCFAYNFQKVCWNVSLCLFIFLFCLFWGGTFWSFLIHVSQKNNKKRIPGFFSKSDQRPAKLTIIRHSLTLIWFIKWMQFESYVSGSWCLQLCAESWVLSCKSLPWIHFKP